MVNLRPIRVSKALKALKREDLMPFVEKQIPIHLDTRKKVSLENPKDNVMSAVVDVSQTIVVTGFKGLVLNIQDANSRISDENSDKFSLKCTNVKSISLDEGKVLCPKRATNGDTTLEGEYEFFAKTGIVKN